MPNRSTTLKPSDAIETLIETYVTSEMETGDDRSEFPPRYTPPMIEQVSESIECMAVGQAAPLWVSALATNLASEIMRLAALRMRGADRRRCRDGDVAGAAQVYTTVKDQLERIENAAKFKITPEMLEAGTSAAYDEYRGQIEPPDQEEVLVAAYLAMVRARLHSAG